MGNLRLVIPGYDPITDVNLLTTYVLVGASFPSSQRPNSDFKVRSLS